MNKYIWIIGALVLVLILGIYIPRRSQAPGPSGTVYEPVPTSTTTPSGTTTVPSSVHAYGLVTLALGETAKFKDLTLTPTTLVEDSRCPVDVQCIQAGTVRVKVSIVSAMGTSTQTITLGTSATTEAETITLSSVSPATKKSTVTVQPSQYRFTFKVVKTASTGPVTGGECYTGGCSQEICSDQPGAISACVFRPEYQCYKEARCERQSNGQCGWTQTSELSMCLNNLPA